MTSPSAAPTLIAQSSAAVTADGRPRTYEVRTFGCQMNVHDSERLSGSLESAGYVPAANGAEADVVVINTCAVRDNAAGKLYGTLGHLKSRKDKHEGMQIAVGGCMAQMDKDAVQQKSALALAVEHFDNALNAETGVDACDEVSIPLQSFANG